MYYKKQIFKMVVFMTLTITIHMLIQYKVPPQENTEYSQMDNNNPLHAQGPAYKDLLAYLLDDNMQNHIEFGKPVSTKLLSEFDKPDQVKLDTKELTSISSSIYNLSPLQLMKVPKIDFIKELKNPCFYVKNPPQNDGGVWVSDDVVLKCWPYFQLIGVEKCGTSDLYHRLTSHHHLLFMRDRSGNKKKEPLWYNGMFEKELHNNSVGGYLSLMNNATHTIKTLCPNNINKNGAAGKDFCPYIIGDFSARTINHNSLWHLEEENQNLTIPKVLVSDKIHHINPDTKIIIILRNPATRLFSDYRFYTRNGHLGFNASQQDFHTRVVEAIEVWEMCVSQFRFHEDACVNGERWAKMRRVRIGRFWSHHSCNRLAVSIYSIFVKHWLRVFPRRNILVIQMEEYSREPLHYLETHILPFLGLEPFETETRNYLVSIEERKNQSSMQMWNETWILLQNFYEPYNRQLADMLSDDKFLWI